MSRRISWTAVVILLIAGLAVLGCVRQGSGDDVLDAGTDTNTDTSTDTNPDTNTYTGSDTGTETDVNTGTDTIDDTSTNIDTDTNVVDTGTGTSTDTHTDTAIDTDTLTDTAIDTDTITDTDTEPSDSLTFPVRGAFYYLWYPQTWTVNGSHVSYHPDLGYYSSDDAEVVDQHIKDMDYAKIDLAIASWWRIDHQSENTRIPLLLDRTKALGSSLKWAFYYESEGFGDPTVEEIKANLNYLMDAYSDHESIARVDGKPVVFVYNSDDGSCEVADRWAQANEGKWYVSLKIFGGFKDCANQPDTWHQYGPDAPAQHHEGYSYVIAPGFWRADLDVLLARDVDRWWQNVADMVASQAPWQLITTFNEWGEGTAVEPASEWASDSGYGLYLDALNSNGAK